MKCCVSDSRPSLHGGSDLTGELSVVTVVSQTHSYKLRLFPFVSNGSFIAAADWRLVFISVSSLGGLLLLLKLRRHSLYFNL